MEVFSDYAYYYNAFYKDKDYHAEAVQIDQLIKKYSNDVNRIISFGCGTGKHDFELNKCGYSMSGIDMSEGMINVARKSALEQGINENFDVADIRYYEASEKYDAVISLFHVISYQTSNEDLLNAFKAARNCLSQGGLFIFDAWYGPGVLSDKPSVRIKEVEDDKYRLVRLARPVMHDQENIVDVNYEVLVIDKATTTTKEIKEVHNMRYLFKPEIDNLLKQAGFELVDVCDCKDLQETSYDSWTAYFVAKAI